MKRFKKIIAKALLLATFASSYSTFAVGPNTPQTGTTTGNSIVKSIEELSPSKLAEYINQKISEFESLAPGVFFVDPDFKNPAKANPYITARLLTQAIKMFKTYPNITKRFVTQVTRCTIEKKFIIKPMDEANRKFIDRLSPGGVPLGCYDEGPITLGIFIDTHEINKTQNEIQDAPKSPITLSVGQDIPSRFAECCITHEIGHLFESVIEFSEIGVDAYRDYLYVKSDTKEAVLSKRDFPKSEKEIRKILDEVKIPPNEIIKLGVETPSPEQRHDILTKIRDGKCEEIKNRIIDLASKDEVNSFVSRYGSFHDKEWFAELFARAHCLKGKHTNLDAAMIYYLQNFEKKLSWLGFDVHRDLLSDKPLCSPLEDIDRLREFEEIAPDNFFISQAFRYPSGGTAGIGDIIQHATHIFRQYPNITKKFIEQLKRCTRRQIFKIERFPTHIPTDMLGSPLYKENSIEFSLLLDPNALKDATERTVPLPLHYVEQGLLREDNTVLIDFTNTHKLVRCYIAKEMGNLFHSVVCYSKNPKLYRKQLEAKTRLERTLQKLSSSRSKPTPEMLGTDAEIFKAYKKLSDKVKQEIIKIAREEYNYTGNGFISQSGENSPILWFEELFAHAICNPDHTPLDRAMLEYLDNFEKSL